MRIEAVTFDFWNTIAAEPVPGSMRDARHAAVLAACESAGLELDADHLAGHVAEVIRSRERAWAEGVHVSPTEGAQRLVTALGLEPAAGETVAAAFLGGGRGVELSLAPEIGPTLERLRADGLALGIVCDAGFTGGAILREFLAAQGLLEHFSGWGFSDEVGAYKPAPEIFEAALTMLDAEPAAAVHVGDLRRTDIAGARALGMASIRYRGLADDPEPGPEADLVLDDHRDLPELIASI
ncbi:MAG TPA: HAD family hydrolase [Solirubrobacterales bacterium]|jgi:putative hydrolase of the HAD superfamily